MCCLRIGLAFAVMDVNSDKWVSNKRYLQQAVRKSVHSDANASGPNVFSGGMPMNRRADGSPSRNYLEGVWRRGFQTRAKPKPPKCASFRVAKSVTP
jgi:hypothetical protein